MTRGKASGDIPTRVWFGNVPGVEPHADVEQRAPSPSSVEAEAIKLHDLMDWQ